MVATVTVSALAFLSCLPTVLDHCCSFEIFSFLFFSNGL
jgi:hypothetical protein